MTRRVAAASLFVFLLVPAAFGQDAAAQGAPAKPHPIDALLGALYSGEAEGPLRVGEPELNDWLATSAALPPGVEDLRATLAPEIVSLHGVVDAGRYRDQLPPNAAAAVSLIEGPLTVELVARLESGRGQGRVTVEGLRLAGIPFPTSLVPMIVAAFTRSAEYPDGFDVTRPFVLPAGLERIRVSRGEAWLDLRQRSPR